MRHISYLSILLLAAHGLMGQTPKIDNVQRIISYPLTEIEITGSGFSTNPAQLKVWFGHVAGTIVSSSENNIRVTVPAQARLGQVEVIHLQSRRSARSFAKLMVNFSGKQPFANSFSATSYSNPDDIFDLCVCDFDGDGRPDIAGSKFKDGKSNLMLLINSSTVSANNSAVGFTQTALPLAFPTFSLTCGDLNGDGKPEIVATRGGTVTGNTIYIFPNTSSVTNVSFSSPIALDLKPGDFAKEVAIHDLNRDGRPDIVVTNGQTNLLYIFENQQTDATVDAAKFTRHDITVGTATNTLALDVADVTGDGWPDIITSPNTNAQRIFILQNPANGSMSFASPTNFAVSGSTNINDIATADFNNDGLLDLVMADRGSNKAFVYLNRGSLIFQSVNSSTGFSSPTAWGVDVGDMNGDGFADFVIGNRDFTNPQVNVFISNGAATPLFTATTIVTPKANWFVRVGDLDGDAKPDIAVTSTNNSTSFSIDIIKNRNCHLPVILNENPLSICSGQNITLRVVPMPAVAFSWSTGSNGPTAGITATNAGTITVTGTGDGGACSGQASLSVVAGAGAAPAKPTLTAPDGVCAGSTLTLTTATVGGSPTYIWRGPNNFLEETNTASETVTTSASLAQSGNYTVTIKVGDCLSDPSDPRNIAVVEPAGFSITSSAGNTGVCTGQSVNLSVNPVSGYTYQWKKGGTNISGQTNPTLTINPVAAADAGSYTVLIAHQSISCSSETGAFSLSVLAAPVASFTALPERVCVGTQVAFDASASTVAATANYAWTFGDGGTGTGAVTEHTYANAQASNTVTLTVSYAGISSCTSSATRNFAINAATPPVIVADPQVSEICSDGSESVTLAVDGNFDSYLWSIATGNTSSSITVKAPGTFSIATIDANGCPGNAEVTLAPKAGCEGGAVPSIIITVPKVFTPNDDQANDFWFIEGLEEYPDCTMNVFDGRGMRVFEAKGSVLAGSPWDGRGTGGPLPDGTYYYVFGCTDAKPVTGSVLIVR
jgi:gliding motility-associated-like protein